MFSSTKMPLLIALAALFLFSSCVEDATDVGESTVQAASEQELTPAPDFTLKDAEGA